LVVIRIHFKI